MLGVGAVMVGCGGESQQATAAQNTVIKSSASEAENKTGHDHGDAAHDAVAHTHTTKMLFSAQPTKVQAGKPATWTLKIVDDIDNTPIKDFETVHEKLMHLIVVSKDLRWFNHLHPEYKGNGVFTVQATLPSGGDYEIFADYTPKEREHEVAQQSVSVEGNPKPGPKLVADKLEGAWMTKRTQSAPEGEPDKLSGTEYEVALMPMPAKMETGKDMMLHFQVRDAQGKPVQLQPYLGALGHLVLISGDAKTYLHTHPMGAEGHEGHGASAAPQSASDVMFHTQFAKPGIYKAWGQFQHNNKIITAPFVLNVGGTEQTAKSTSTSATGQKLTVNIDGGYSPSTLNVKAGQPVEITFVRQEKLGCGDVVQIPTAGIKRTLKTGEKTTMTFTPKAGTTRFTCGMDMYDGKIVAE